MAIRTGWTLFLVLFHGETRTDENKKYAGESAVLKVLLT